MASYPPPYSPPPAGPPFGYDPRQQRQFLKDQARAQKNAFKAQCDLYRQQSRLMRRGSILGPLMIVAVGLILLLVHSGRISFDRFAVWYGHWWPMLLVAAGIILVAEWGFDQARHRDGVPFVRRGIGGGVIFLLILLAIAGGALSQFSRGHEWMDSLHIGPDNFNEIFGEKREREQRIDQDFPTGGSLSVDNPHGDVTILGTSTDNQIHVVVNKQISSSSDSAADDIAQRIDARIDRIGNTLNITVPSATGANADVSITLPESGQTSISANHGDVHVTGMKAPVNASSSHGDIEINNIAAPVIARMAHNGSSFTAHNVTGDLALKGHAENLMITDVTGQVTLEGEFYGDTHLEHLTGPISFKTNRTQWTLARLDGQADMSSDSELSASQLVGPVAISTRSRNISFDRILGDISVTNSNGTVDLTNASPLGNITVENRNGAVNLTLPERAGFTIAAENRDGDIDNDFGLSIKTQGNVNRSLLGTVGDGHSHISLKTTHGDLNIHKGEVAPPAPPTPAAPAAPPAPPARLKKPARPTKTVEF